MRALVTGASSGIGAAIAARLAREGWQVTGLSRSAPGPGIAHLPVDLSDPTATRQALATLPPQDAVIHAAGLLRVGRHEALDLSDGAAMWRLHVEVAAELIKSLVPAMPDGGRVVLIGSRVAQGAAGRSLYAASKAALVGLARSVAANLPRAGSPSMSSPPEPPIRRCCATRPGWASRPGPRRWAA
jgi:NAD(P)-dependent dehydrogenase (short-subunit alcohol dehydrogenase family)